MTIDQSQVSEAAARHSSVVRVSAQDPEGGAVTFSIMEGDPEAVFTMGESTGEIRVMGDMDREAREQYELVSGATLYYSNRRGPGVFCKTSMSAKCPTVTRTLYRSPGCDGRKWVGAVTSLPQC